MRLRWFLTLIVAAGLSAPTRAADDWSEQQVEKLPKGEKPVRLFNGKDLDGWEGQVEKYWSVEDGVIVAKNGKDDAPKASTYLVTKEKYRNFRLIFEAKLVESEMHSGIALWGQTVEKEGDPHSYMGHLVMFPSHYGYWDLYRRNSIYQDKDGVAQKAGKQHDWNRMEILAIDNRIRHVVNGKLVADWSDPMPELCQPGPIGLQLHSNNVPQEVRFRGLILTEDPEDRVVTADDEGTASADPAGAGMDAETLAKIPQAMRKFVEAKEVSGVVALVARKGKVVHLSAVGQADVEDNRPMREDTVFAIASMTKPITATAVMILQDEGKLSIDDPVSKYIPEFADAALEGGGRPKREITIRDVLTHTSGLTGEQKNEGTIAETARMLAKRPLAFEPGEKWQYSPGLTVAGRVVEVASGQPFEEFLDERIFRPLGMKDTTFHPTTEQRQRLARLYEKKDGELRPAKHWLTDLEDRTPNPSGGLFSTARDMARFYQMVLNGGELDGARVVSRAGVEQMTSVQTDDLKTGFTDGNGWGLGWCVIRKPQGVTEKLSPGTYGHGGAFGTQGWVDPRRELIVVLMIQRMGLLNSDASDLRKALQEHAAGAVRK